MTRSFKRDASFVERHLADLTRQAEGQGKKVVLVRGRKVAGFYNSEIEATKAGFTRFGADEFLVRAVLGSEARGVVASNLPAAE